MVIMDDKKKCLVPALRFDGFEGEWNQVALGEIAKGIMYGMNSAAGMYDGIHKYIRITDIDESYRTFSPNPLTSPVGIIEKKYQLEENDIVFTRTGASVGKAYLYKKNDGNLFFAGFLIKFSIIKANPSFVLYQTYRTPYWKWVKVMSMRSGQPGLNSEEYKSYRFHLPSLLEQQKIVNFLSSVDKKIEQLRQKENLLEDYKKGMMQQIFSQQIRFKDDNGEAFADWEHTKLGKLTYKVGKKNKDNIQYPVYSINNQEGFLPQSKQFEGMDSKDRGYDISLYKIIKKETFAYNPARINVGSIGFSGQLNNIIISSLYVCFKTKENLEDVYLLKFLDTFDFNKGVLRNVEGGVRQYLFYDNFSSIKIPLPSNKEQLKIADFLDSIDKKIKQNQQKLKQAQTFKKGLLQQLFV